MIARYLLAGIAIASITITVSRVGAESYTIKQDPLPTMSGSPKYGVYDEYGNRRSTIREEPLPDMSGRPRYRLDEHHHPYKRRGSFYQDPWR